MLPWFTFGLRMSLIARVLHTVLHRFPWFSFELRTEAGSRVKIDNVAPLATGHRGRGRQCDHVTLSLAAKP